MNAQAAIAERDAGMAQAQEHAEAVIPHWPEWAYLNLRQFLISNGGGFTSEQAGDWCHDRGLPLPPTRRAWGAVYVRLAKEGAIVQCGIGRALRRHNSICPLWRRA
jgi:hypothetical protein